MTERIYNYPAEHVFHGVQVRFNVDNNTNIFLVFTNREFDRTTGQFQDKEIEFHATGELHEFIYQWLKNNKER